MPSRTTVLPLSRSEFLQDVVIALGRWRKGFKYHMANFECDVTEHGDDDDTYECLTISCQPYCGISVTLDLWDDRTAQVRAHGSTKKNQKRPRLSFYPDISNFTPEGIFVALKESTSNGAGLDCLTEIWEHEGEVFR